MSRVDFSKIKTIPLGERKSKISVKDFHPPFRPENYQDDILDIFPGQFAGNTIRNIVSSVTEARNRNRPVILAMGAHSIKCGLSRIILQLLSKKIITGLALNGAGAVHDLEIFLSGKTSEDVEDSLKRNIFGMSEETGKFMNEALKTGVAKGLGFGASLSSWMNHHPSEYSEYSLFANSKAMDYPVTVHVAIGTDIVHQHPAMDGAVTGEASYRDFRSVTETVSEVIDGGVWINLGSAVILPEVFLKAYSVVLNLGFIPKNFTTVNMDIIRQYRPEENVVRRPESKGLFLQGHHEINLPLIALALLRRLGGR